jgi:hypothetical protein
VNHNEILSTVDASEIVELPFAAVKVEGFFIGVRKIDSRKAMLINRLDEPRIEIALPDFVYDYVYENIPEILRLGVPHLWLEQVVITGHLGRHLNKVFFEDVELIEFTDSKKVLDLRV